MKFTLSWLKDFLKTEASLDDITAKLTAIGLEVEGVEDRGKTLSPFIIAEILEAEKHPDADKLRVCKVNTGRETLQIVCGAPNARAGIKVVLAPIGTVMPLDADFVIKKSKIRGVESNGMLCSARELGLGDDHEGIIELPTDAPTGSSYADAGFNDPVIEIAITPNRGDCLGVYGIARDLAAAGLGKFIALDAPHIKGKGASSISVRTETTACPWFIGRLFKNVENGASPDWLQQRLKAIGLRPISALVDITNYISFSYGRPLHVFDADRLKGNLVVRSAKNGEKLVALDGNTYELKEGMTVIADEAGVQALGGIIGGMQSGCTSETKNVFLEVAWFDPENIAKTGRALTILSDARYRFERGVDPALMPPITDLVSEIIHDWCGGEISDITEAGKSPHVDRVITFDTNRIQALTGIVLPATRIKEILTALGFRVAEKGAQWQVTAPSFRPDVEGEPDLVEEVARIHGYDHLPQAPLPPAEKLNAADRTPLQNYTRIAQYCLAARGLMEACTWAFLPRKQAELFGGGKEELMLANPISSDLDTMRPSVLPNLIDAYRKNADRGFGDLALFEVGAQYEGIGPEKQRRIAAGIRSGEAISKNVHGNARTVDVFDAKADAEAVLAACGVAVEKLQITAEVPSWYHPGRSGRFSFGPKLILGYFGEIHPRVLKALDVKGPVVGFEIMLDAVPLPKKSGNARAPLQASDFQAVARDFAFLVDQTTSAADIVKSVQGAEKNLLEAVDIFDVYTGKGVEEGKKSIALRVTLRAQDRTLAESEIEAVCAAIIGALQKSVGAVLRS